MTAQNRNDKTEKSNSDTKITRRKAVKTIAGGVTALAAYQYLPAKWDKPILESIFIPAHAQTSGYEHDHAHDHDGDHGHSDDHNHDHDTTHSSTDSHTHTHPLTPDYYSGTVTFNDSGASPVDRDLCVSIIGDNAVVYYYSASSTPSGTGTVSGGVTLTAGFWTYQVTFSNLNQNTVTVDVNGVYDLNTNRTRTGSADLNSTDQACS